MKIKNIFIVLCLLFINSLSFAADSKASFQEKLAALEASTNGRIGVSAINTGDNSRLQYRSEERFPFCSTSKVIGISAVLKQSMKHPNLLQQKITYKKEDLTSNSPITEKHLADGMTVGSLCAAAITYSDNGAINILMDKFGGPETITAFARSIGDKAFRLDRREPELNSAIPGDLRDTTTPAAMGKSLQQLVLGNTLGQSQRIQLQTWLQDNTTGDARIRASIPKGWIVGDKTGTGDYGTTNDIAVIWPSKGAPIVMVIYFTQNQKDAAPREDVIAAATRIVLDEFVKKGNYINA
jgi:beta-lactamase class A